MNNKHNRVRIYLIAFILLLISNATVLDAQEIKPGIFIRNNSNTIMKIGKKDTLFINGDLENSNPSEFLTIHNVGHLYLTGNLTDSGRGLFQSSSYANVSNERPDTVSKQPSNSLKEPLGHIYFVGKNGIQNIFSKIDTSIWLANMHVYNTVKLQSSIRVLDTLVLGDTVDLNGHDISHYIYDNFQYTGNWGQLKNETTDTSFVYDYNPSPKGHLRMLKKEIYLEQFDHLNTMGLEVAYESNSAILVARGHKKDLSVTEGTINKYYDIENSHLIESDKYLKINYYHRDFSTGSMQEKDFALWEIRMDTVKPRVRQINSVLKEDENSIKSNNDSLSFVNVRYGVASKHCSDSLIIDLGKDTILCIGNTLTLTVPNSELDHQPARYEWKVYANNKDSLLHPLDFDRSSLKLDSAGEYSVRVVDNKGCESVDTIKVSIAPKPVPVILVENNEILKCETEPFKFSYSDAVTNATNAVWNFDDNTNSTEAAPIKSYAPICKKYNVKLTLTSNIGCTAEKFQEVEVEQSRKPKIHLESLHDSIGNFLAIDTLQCGTPVSLITWDVEGETVGNEKILRYQFPTYKDYQLKLCLTGTTCTACTQETIAIKEMGIPTFTFAQTTKNTYCVGEKVAFINTSEVNYGSFTYYWNYGNGQTTQDSIPTEIRYTIPDTYVVELIMKGNKGYQKVYTEKVYITPNPEIGFGDSISHCKDKYTFIPKDTSSDYKYEWKKEGTTVGGNKDTLLVTENGNYSLTISNNTTGCKTTENVYLTLKEQLRPRLGNDITACGSVLLDAHNFRVKYNWSTGESTQEIKVSQSGTYSVQILDTVDGCEGYDTINVTINRKPNANLGTDLFICDNETLTLKTPINEDDASYLWSNGAKTNNIIISNAAQYTVIVTYPNGCSDADTIVIHHNEAPKINIGGEKYLCNNQEILLSQKEHYYGNVTWIYPNGDTIPALETTTNQNGYHYILVNYKNGCSALDSVMVTKRETQVTANFMLSSKINKNDTVQFINLSMPDTLKLAYEWKINGTKFPESDVENPQLYVPSNALWLKDTMDVVLTVSDGACPVSKLKQIIVLSDMKTKIFDPQTGEETIIGDTIYNTYIDILDAKLYPNPSSGKFAIDLKLTTQANILYVITNANGQIMDKKILEASTNEKIDFDLSHYSKGIYFIHLATGSKTKLFKIVLL